MQYHVVHMTICFQYTQVTVCQAHDMFHYQDEPRNHAVADARTVHRSCITDEYVQMCDGIMQ
jgi:hypothetical protein